MSQITRFGRAGASIAQAEAVAPEGQIACCLFATRPTLQNDRSRGEQCKELFRSAD
jgi:hypothetical protein